MAKKTETYAAAETRLLAELAASGFVTSSHSLKTPWAEPRDRSFRISFESQAVYLNAHSLFLDRRGMPLADLLARVSLRLA